MIENNTDKVLVVTGEENGREVCAHFSLSERELEMMQRFLHLLKDSCQGWDHITGLKIDY